MIQEKASCPILITGVERSGSSIIARIINACGAYNGTHTEMQENVGIKHIVNSYYKSINIPKNGQYPLPDTNRLSIPIDWKNTILSSMYSQRYDGKQSWMYKSSRISQLWPIWNYAFPNAKWIIVRRRTGSVISSCMNTAYMNAYKDPKIQKEIGVTNENDGWLWWVHEHEKLFVNMMQEGLNCKVVWPEKMVYGDYQQIYEMLEWLGLSWNDSLIQMIEPLLWNSKQKEGVKK